MRRANKDTQLPSGGGPDGKKSLLVCKGQRVIISIFGTQRNRENFGEDALDFRPERWDEISINNPGFMAFSMGPRLCTGRKMPYP
jgi:cytochrome P450